MFEALLPVRLDLIAVDQPAVCFSQIRQRNLHRIQTLLYAGQRLLAIVYIAVLRIRIRDSRSGTFLTPGSQTNIFESLVTIFWGKQFYNSFKTGSIFFSFPAQNLNNFEFVIFVATKKVGQQICSPSFFVLLLLVPGSGMDKIRIRDPG